MSFIPSRPTAEDHPQDSPAADPGFLVGGGEMGARMRVLDWTATPLGSPAGWPQSLKTIVRVMLDSRYAMWMLWGPELTFFCNDAYLPTLGIKRDWALGSRSDKVWEEIWADIGPRIARVLEQGRATWDEALLLFLERSGFSEETYHTFSYSPVYDDESHISGMLCVVTEDTDRVVGERRLRMLRDLAARAVGAASVEQTCRRACEVLEQHPFGMPFAAIYLLNQDSCSARRVAHTRGLPEHALPATLDGSSSPWPLEELLSSEAPQLVARLPKAGVQVPAGPWPDLVQTVYLLPLKSAGGERLTGFLVAAASPRRPLDEAYRTFFGLVAGQIAAAVADAQAAEAERRRAEALAEIDRAKTTFFSNISHEFRTPLTLMLGPLEDAAANAATPLPVREQLQLAHRNSLRLLKLVNSLLDFSRFEAGRVQASFEATDLADHTSDLASTFRSAMERAGLAFSVECAPLAEPVYVDREMWEKIVLNLLSNAFKFTLRGSVTVRVRGEGRSAVLEVRDTGSGIPEHELPHLFERFHRVEGTAGRTLEGSGIGLALVHELVKLHGGTIDVASELGAGTTFRVNLRLGLEHLPRDRIKAPPAQVSSAVGAQAFVQEALRWTRSDTGENSARLLLADGGAQLADQRFAATAGARVVLADDNADMRGYVHDLLAQLYAVEAVADGAQALEAACRERPDLILSDIMMPRIDGLELVRAIRGDERLRDVPVILLSARAGEESRVEGLGAGADDYLVKPFSARELLARVGALLELAQMRRDAQQALREREEQLRLATEAAEVGLWDVDMLTGTLYWPPRIKAMFGISPDVPVSMDDFYAGLHPDDCDATSTAFTAAADPVRRAVYDVEYRTVGKEDGVIRWVAAKGRGIFDGNGKCVRVIGAAIDITARKRVDERLHEETRVQELLGGVSHALIAAQLDTRKVVQIVTDAATELSGASFGAFFYNVQDEKGEWYSLYTLSGAPREAFARFPHPRKTGVFGPTFRGEGVVRSADITLDPRYGQNPPYRGMPEGHLPVRSYLAVPVMTASGKVVGGLFFGHPEADRFDERAERLVLAIAAQAAVALDNASLHQASQHEIGQRKRIQEALDEASRRKDEFLAMLAHELRNPLSPIGTASELLARTVGDDPRAHTAIGMIKRQVTQLTRLVDDLLDVSRITQGRIHLRRRPAELVAVITQAIETVEPQLREKRHNLSVHASSYEPLYVMGDFARLVQCVGNILANAVKYTEPAGEISIHTRADGARACIVISDTGAGIPAELLPKVFDLFVQSERTLDRSQGGLGVGLAVVKRLVEMHDGEVDVTSEGLGKGSTFEIRLPRIPRPTKSATSAIPVTAEPRRILIVDDNVDAADSLSMLLGAQGHETRVAYSALDALTCVETFRPEVGILDIGLPEVDGYELAKRLRAMAQMTDLKLVALTGYGQMEDQQRALACGFDAHLVKPIDLSALERVLTTLSRTS